jgi:hypothetical protein
MDDWWDVDAKAGFVRGQRTGVRIGIGDVAKVFVTKVDLARRELGLAIHEILTRGGKAKPQQDNGGPDAGGKKHGKKGKHRKGQSPAAAHGGQKALVGSIPDGERIVTVEEVAELSIDRDDWIALETRPPDGVGAARTGGIDLAALVHGALRMRPDRLIVGDVRGAEALELGTALGASVDGAVVALTGEGPQAALARWVALAQLAAPASSEPAVRELVAGAADVTVHVARFADGGVRVISIEEVLGVREVGFDTQTLFSYRGAGDDGGFAATGAVPRFWADLDGRGIKADASIFKG